MHKSEKILLLGGSGFVGKYFIDLFDSKKLNYHSLSRSELDYTLPGNLYNYLKDNHFTFLLNVAGYTGKPNVDACEDHKAETLFANAILPSIISDACSRANIPWGHMSSGCIFSGKRSDGKGFLETDTPNFTFKTGNSSFYSGSKALGEELLENDKNCYIWRLRIPFDNQDSPRNYITKVMQYDTLLDVENSISHIPEAVAAAYACREKNVPFGTYHITNPGSITTREIASLLKEYGLCDKTFKFFESEEDFMKKAARTPRSSCVLDSSKLASVGIKMHDVRDAVKLVLAEWESAK